MRPSYFHNRVVTALLAVAVCGGASWVGAAGAPVAREFPKSYFDVSPDQGRNPFFRAVTPRIEVKPGNDEGKDEKGGKGDKENVPARKDPLDGLATKGVTGRGADRIALIAAGGKNYDLKVGESFVLKAEGSEFRLRCVEITDEHVKLAVEGSPETRTIPVR
ncbi:MAG: hypothetical protein AB1705_08170 [Verrucomicrobiota bacterium]